MTIEQLEILGIAIVVSTACVIPGVFLVLRRVALMSDAISHAILLGIVVMFFFVKNLHSPLLMVGAVLSGLLTVVLTEAVIHSQKLKEDAAIGLIFPIFFSLGVILISRYAKDIHLDVDAVLLGELAFAPFNQLMIDGVAYGPIALWVMSAILVLNALFVSVFYKELKLVTFDPGLAVALGIGPVILHYALMTVVSVTAVGAFDAVGSILVVALMITTPSAAYLLTNSLSWMMGLSVLLGIATAVLGYGLAMALNASIAGSMATMSGVLFLGALFFSPSQGLLQKYLRRKQQRISFSSKMLLVHLFEHEGMPDESTENTLQNMVSHMGWTDSFSRTITAFGINKGYLNRDKDFLYLTPLGREKAKDAMVNL